MRSITLGGKAHAITMWDFSWLERRWPGAGYESFETALDELCERGYTATRIDAYPHLVAAGLETEWELLPVWNQQAWGAPAKVRVRVQPTLNEFLAACRKRDLKVALSTWFREDTSERRLMIPSAEAHAAIWEATLRSIPEDLHDVLLFVDFCNEWPQTIWAPFFRNEPGAPNDGWYTETSLRWMRESVTILRRSFPDLPLTYSFAFGFREGRQADLGFLDLLEPHVWLANNSDFNDRVDYHFEKFETRGFENLVARGEALYRADPAHWHQCLRNAIEDRAAWSREQDKPLVTTEAWAVIDFKDGPGLNWDWVKDLTMVGVEAAIATGRWAGICTSNFCGPQFVGMWRDLEWHREATQRITAADAPDIAWEARGLE